MKENISITGGAGYEKIDKPSWLICPKYDEVKPTIFIDVSKITLFPEDERRKIEDVSDEEIMKIVKENMINSDAKSLSLKK